MSQRYLVALGSNVRHRRHGLPQCVLKAALSELDRHGLKLEAAAPIRSSLPIGPSRRRYANSAAIVKTGRDPAGLLACLKRIESSFGRRREGQRWSARVLDLDIVVWQGGCWCFPGLTIPHIAFRQRRFVLQPAAAIAPCWRDPVTGLTLRQLHARLTRPRPLPRAPAW